MLAEGDVVELDGQDAWLVLISASTTSAQVSAELLPVPSAG